MLAYLSKHNEKLEMVINSSPTLLFYNGAFIDNALTKEVITREEIYSAVRKYRINSMDQVKAVVLELNGSLTVVRKNSTDDYTSLDDLAEQENSGVE
jgi:uncharacterized membrane protein YcaP (DUF421 family)